MDLLSGEHQVLKTWIVHENGLSLHPEIDRGQITGAFVQSHGWCTMEELPVNDKGRYLAVNPSTYKIPTVRDLPSELDIPYPGIDRRADQRVWQQGRGRNRLSSMA